MMKMKTIIMSVTAVLLAVCLSGCSVGQDSNKSDMTIKEGIYRKIVYSLVSSAENSSLDYAEQYSYIEDIGDGRGYTAGIIGFTSGTGDLLEVINRYIELKPTDNVLQKYVSALEQVNGSDSHVGLRDDFISDWQKASNDSEMIQAQDEIVDEMYMDTAVKYANRDGLSLLGEFIYYDALVVHGPGNDEDSFGGIRGAAIREVKTPVDGGAEGEYLLAFLDARSIIMMKEEAHSDLSRIEAQRNFIHDGNYNLSLPLIWTMYGDDYELSEEDLK
ncbi:MAG: chitosanase [Lachnospiraceae bacterium]|nr:chitosanase [Lachnospiraceae bacterium]